MRKYFDPDCLPEDWAEIHVEWSGYRNRNAHRGLVARKNNDNTVQIFKSGTPYRMVGRYELGETIP